jgi:hypothetical protein
MAASRLGRFEIKQPRTAPPLFTFLINFNKKTHILGETAPSADYEIIVFIHNNTEKYAYDQSN